jgi:hypothetical protein
VIEAEPPEPDVVDLTPQTIDVVEAEINFRYRQLAGNL